MNRVSLYEELRLIERSENEVSGAWKGAHLLLFFLAFVFGSICTFCFHMLMYLFDEKCVLFPKLLSLTSLRHNVIYEFIPEEKERVDSLPVDFLSTQWVEKSACYLPTYVPLISGIFGLVWTTMFLMCSSGTRSLNGLQRSWRVIPPMLIFSLAMSGLCIYSSAVTHYGLQELCVKLGEITGSSTCSYTVNVATLAYERQIRGVYQATKLTITSAWLHTCCWLASAILAIARILLAVDFRLVKIRVELVGDTDKMLERNERHLRTVMPNQWTDDDQTSVASEQMFFQNEQYDEANEVKHLTEVESDTLFMSEHPVHLSEQSLLPEERNKWAKLKVNPDLKGVDRFVKSIVLDLQDTVDNVLSNRISNTRNSSLEVSENKVYKTLNAEEATEIYKDIREQLQERLDSQLPGKSQSSRKKSHTASESSTASFYDSGSNSGKSDGSAPKKSNLRSKPKSIGIETEKKEKDIPSKSGRRVTIAESEQVNDPSSTAAVKEPEGKKSNENETDSDKKYDDSQTKEKQD